jgi:hypothetical protein
MTSARRLAWEGCGACVRGASHVRSGLPNQDAFSWRSTDSEAGFTGVLAVADGHGNSKSFRSDWGAKLAIRTATEVLEGFADGFRGHGNLAAVERAMEVDLPKRIVQQWLEAVDEHRQGQPFTAEELAKLDAPGRKAVEETAALAYGTTLVAVLVTDRFLLYAQLGDGDIVVVSEQGQATRPLQADERLFANETTSLCSLGSAGDRRRPGGGPAGAWSEFRTRLDAGLETPPALILVSTDGYANSFRSEADFMKVGPDLLEIIKEEGLDHVRDRLGSWLQEASQAGSGDDVTLGLICRRDAIKGFVPTSAAASSTPSPPEPARSEPAGHDDAVERQPTAPKRAWYQIWRK